MRIAAPYENGRIFGHFGHAGRFKIYEVEGAKIVNQTIVDINGSGNGALAGLSKKLSVDTLVYGGIGRGAKLALADAGITLYGGVSGDADTAVKAFIAGKLSYNTNVKCSHQSHGRDGNTCGEHGCGYHGE